MTNQELTQLLRRMKDAPEFGGGFDVKRSWKTFASKNGFSAGACDAPSSRYTFADYAGYVGHVLGQHVLRPVSVTVSAFLIIFGSWVATVNASFDSVPGDILYPVKLVTERMQLTFASSTQQRARLHAEFASRRLQEVVEISNSDRQGKTVLVQAAVDGFKQELVSAGEELSSLQSNAPSDATQLAIDLDHKTDEYEALLSQSGPAIGDESQVAVDEALVAVQQSNSQAIDSLVTSNETTEEPVTTEHLQQNFQQQYQDIKLRIATNTGRLSIIAAALPNISGDTSAFEERIETAQTALAGHDAALNEAMDTLAAGGYRRAFEILDQIDGEIVGSEQIITQIEIEISTALAPPESP